MSSALENMRANAKQFNDMKKAALEDGSYHVNFNGQDWYYWGGAWKTYKPSGYYARFEKKFSDDLKEKQQELHKAWIQAYNESGEVYGRWFHFPLYEDMILEDMDIARGSEYWIKEWTLPVELEDGIDLEQANAIFEEIQKEK